MLLGKALHGRRDEVVITSKVRGAIGDGPNDDGLSRYHILREVERSLQRLNTDRIDVYLIHGPDETTPMEETLRALDSLVQQGKIRYVGICNHQAWQVVQTLRVQERLNTAPLIAVQNPYNLLNRELEREMFPMVAELGLGVMVYSPLAVSLLSGVYRPDTLPEENSLWGGWRRHAFQDVVRDRVADVVAEVIAVAERGRGDARSGLAGVDSLPHGSDVHHLRRGYYRRISRTQLARSVWRCRRRRSGGLTSCQRGCRRCLDGSVF